jgi:hypothetical protein
MVDDLTSRRRRPWLGGKLPCSGQSDVNDPDGPGLLLVLAVLTVTPFTVI